MTDTIPEPAWTRSELNEIVDAAWSKLTNQDGDLINCGASERAVAHRLALYLESEFVNRGHGGWHFDCEYNRMLDGDHKSIKDFEQVAAEMEDRLVKLKNRKGLIDKILRGESFCIYPDVIVHHRGESTIEHNLVAIEIKKSSNREGDDLDVVKLTNLTSPQCRFQYRFGLFLQFEDSSLENCIWFENGHRID